MRYLVTKWSSIMLGFLVCLVLLAALVSPVRLPDEQCLFGRIFIEQTYDSNVRPVYNSSQNVEVHIGFSLIQIMDMDEKNQVLAVNAWLDMTWLDERISWNASDYNGLELLRLPAKHLWLPDIVLYNNADDYGAGFMPINAMIFSDGHVSWGPPVRLRSSCKVVTTFFPFDHQICRLKFGSWAYDKAQVDLINKSAEVDLSNYVSNGEWVLINYRIIRNEVVYPISDAIYPDVTVILTIQRRVLYYVLNILIPCFWFNILSILTFCLPPDAGEKITLSITVLLSYTVFMLLVADTMPPTSEFVPLIGLYLTVSMAVASVSVVLAIVVMKLHHTAPNQREVPPWVRHWILGYFARLVRCHCSAALWTPFRQSSLCKRCRNSHDEHEDQAEILLRDKIVTGTRVKLSDKTPGSVMIRNQSMLDDSEDSESDGLPTVQPGDLQTSPQFHKPSSRFKDGSQTGANDALSANERIDQILKNLTVLVEKSNEETQESDIVDEWKQVALVVDRMFFWAFLIITAFSSIVMLAIVPAMKYIDTAVD